MAVKRLAAGSKVREEELVCSRTSYACGLTAISTDEADTAAFVDEVARDAAAIKAGFALIFFSQQLMTAAGLALAMKKRLPKLPYAACSTAGEITPGGLQDGQAVCMLFPAETFTASSTMVREISTSGIHAIAGKVETLKRSLADKLGKRRSGKVFALCLIDGLSYAEEAVTSAIHWQLDDIPLIGGSAGDDLKFQSTTLVNNGEVASEAAIIILFSTDVPFHVFKTDNFVATENKLVVTASDPDHRVVYEFNARNAAEEYASAVGLLPKDLNTFSFASYPTIVRVGGEHFCRSIQKTNEDGSMSYFCAIDDGIVLSIARAVDMVEATDQALQEVDDQLGGIDVVLGFDCVLRRLDAVNRQAVRGLSELYKKNHVIGFGTYGEQYQSMHLNQTFTGIAFGKNPADASV
ncbi:MAG: FIST N-terminal domain-containing protein [Rhizobiaceae bacterium]